MEGLQLFHHERWRFVFQTASATHDDGDSSASAMWRRMTSPYVVARNAPLTQMTKGNSTTALLPRTETPAPRPSIKHRLPTLAWSGPVQVLETPDAMHHAVSHILSRTANSDDANARFLGFDTETRPCFRKGQWNPASLVQLATADCVYLFRICKNPSSSTCISPLLPIFESPTLLKCGVGIAFDVWELLRLQSFTPRGFCDVVDVTRTQLGYPAKGLQSLAAVLLRGHMAKSKRTQLCNWAGTRLTPEQITYAATDAWVGRELYGRAIAEQASRRLPPVAPVDFMAVVAQQKKQTQQQEQSVATMGTEQTTAAQEKKRYNASGRHQHATENKKRRGGSGGRRSQKGSPRKPPKPT